MKRKLLIAAAIVLAVFAVWIVFRDTDWRAVGGAIGRARPEWIALAFTISFSGYFIRVRRWGSIVRAVDPGVSHRSLFSAQQIGLLANFVLPARTGEAVRAVTMSRLTRMPLPECFGMVALDRLSDIFGLLLVTVLAVASLALGGDAFATERLAHGDPEVVALLRATVVGAGILAATAVAAVAMAVTIHLRPSFGHRAIDLVFGWMSRPVADRLKAALDGIARGMHVLRSRHLMARSLGFSTVAWLLAACSIWAILTAFGLDFPWFSPLLILAMVALFIALPVTPGVVGQYHLAVFAGVMFAVPGADSSSAKAVSIVCHAVMLLPIGVLGVYCMLREGLRAAEVRKGPPIGAQDPGGSNAVEGDAGIGALEAEGREDPDA